MRRVTHEQGQLASRLDPPLGPLHEKPVHERRVPDDWSRAELTALRRAGELSDPLQALAGHVADCGIRQTEPRCFTEEKAASEQCAVLVNAAKQEGRVLRRHQ
ncbi:MAG: hypothetical protein IPI67_13650 [Myxococcales bacterium]|nr:hypothetical protein [Myxococcales bacterium]